MMKVIIAGSRNATRADVRQALDLCPWSGFISVVVSGTARGADQEGEQWAEEYGLKVERFPATWEHDGKQAGPLRNIEMAKSADGLIAIWDGQSRGTKNMIENARKLGLRIFLLRTDLKLIEEFPAEGRVNTAWEVAEERAGIMEYEGGMDRKSAERIAGSRQHENSNLPS